MITSWDWDFGDGSTHLTTQNPQHIYASGGVYTVTLTVVNNSGVSSSSRSLIQVYNVDNRTVTYDLDYGDGSAHSTTQTSQHIYASSGTYTAVLNTQDNVGHSATTRYLIQVYNIDNRTFTYDLDYGDGSSHSTTQTSQHIYSSGGAYSITLTTQDNVGHSASKSSILNVYESGGRSYSTEWDFGDGTTHSILDDPSHTYSSSGMYIVTLIQHPDIGDDVSTSYPIRAYALPPTGISSWYWDFGNGSTSTDSDPTNIYNSGFYTASLTISNGAESSVSSYAFKAYTPPQYGITSYLWNFEDGSTSSIADPTNIFSTSGFYGVNLTVNDIYESDTFTYPIVVRTLPFYDVTSWHWNFGDGSTSTLEDPYHLYANSGIYIVSLYLRSSGVQSETLSYPIIVRASDELVWNWTFGDGGRSSQQNPTHIFTIPGIYETILVTSQGWYSYTDTETITVSGVIIPISTSSVYKVVLTNCRTTPYRLVGDKILTKIELKRNRHIFYQKDVPIEIVTNVDGYTNIIASGITNDLGMCYIEADTNYSGITNILGLARSEYDNNTVYSNLVRINFR